MWLQLTKYLFYLSFFLNIVCGCLLYTSDAADDR